eukprot:TRINITY_DN2826_c0_g1_i21.p1 TRINITY_DN2826_c0_g1~~TRINITY_DN2826_c0_g1_i21.p1  ORF type:complete len:118 (-),score=17.00 TRINITY_DN2826_c0_g1_i21:213-566(-)
MGSSGINAEYMGYAFSSSTSKRLRSELRRRLRNRFTVDKKTKSSWIGNEYRNRARQLLKEEDYFTNVENKFDHEDSLRLPGVHSISSKRDHLYKSFHRRNKKIVCKGRYFAMIMIAR